MPRLGRNSAALVGPIVVGVILVLWVYPVRGAEWSMEPSFGVKGEYNDNILITTAAHDPVYGVWYSPGTRFKYRTEVLEVEGNAAADFVNYYGNSGFDITNYYFPTTAKYRTEKDTLRLDGAYIRDNTLVGELQQTGVVNRRTQRNWWNVNPAWKHSLTDRLAVTAEYQYTKADYQNGVQFNLFNYTTNLGSAGLEYQVTKRDLFTVNGYYLEYQAPFFSLDSHYFGGQLGLSHEFTETLQAAASVGFKNISSSQNIAGASANSSDLVWVFNVNAQKRFERSDLSLGFSRDVNPSGVGFLVQTDHLAASARFDITQTLTASFTGDVFWISPTVVASVIPNSRFMYLQPRLHYRWTEWWSVELAYRYARVDVDVTNTTASQNALYLSVVYNLPKLVWSW